jgi:hypothetical protein
MNPTLLAVLQALYKSEINCEISSFWDVGWEVKLGDRMNGWRAQARLANDDLESAARWLIAEAKRAYPNSDFAKAW